MLGLVLLLLDTLRSALRGRGALVLENLVLRQQLAAFAHRGRPHVTTVDRWFWISLRRRWRRWPELLVFVKPETVVTERLSTSAGREQR